MTKGQQGFFYGGHQILTSSAHVQCEGAWCGVLGIFPSKCVDCEQSFEALEAGTKSNIVPIISDAAGLTRAVSDPCWCCQLDLRRRAPTDVSDRLKEGEIANSNQLLLLRIAGCSLWYALLPAY